MTEDDEEDVPVDPDPTNEAGKTVTGDALDVP
jgi:hypothetical protein